MREYSTVRGKIRSALTDPLFSWKNLAATKFGPVCRPQLRDFLAKIFWKLFVGRDSQNRGQHVKLQIRDAAVLSFQPGDGIPARIPAEQLQLLGHTAGASLHSSLQRPS